MIIGKESKTTKVGWGAVMVWFSANVLSQAAFIGTHGVPYNADAMLATLGPWSWLLVTIELGVWLIVGVLVYQKFHSTQKKSLSSS